MQYLEVSGAVRHIYIYVIRRLKVKCQVGERKTAISDTEYCVVLAVHLWLYWVRNLAN